MKMRTRTTTINLCKLENKWTAKQLRTEKAEFWGNSGKNGKQV